MIHSGLSPGVDVGAVRLQEDDRKMSHAWTNMKTANWEWSKGAKATSARTRIEPTGVVSEARIPWDVMNSFRPKADVASVAGA